MGEVRSSGSGASVVAVSQERGEGDASDSLRVRRVGDAMWNYN